MKAAVVEEIGKPLVVHRDWPDPDCGMDEAVIRVEANGTCRTDHHMWKGAGPGWALRRPFPSYWATNTVASWSRLGPACPA